jgi:TPR repeat protein
LASLYHHGEGVEADAGEAAKWCQLAAEQEVPEAQLILADCYLRGRGVPEDYVLAYVWFNRASSHGLEIAEKNKRHTARYMMPEQIAQAQQISRAHLAA